jgi:hypothetical protein
MQHLTRTHDRLESPGKRRFIHATSVGSACSQRSASGTPRHTRPGRSSRRPPHTRAPPRVRSDAGSLDAQLRALRGSTDSSREARHHRLCHARAAGREQMLGSRSGGERSSREARHRTARLLRTGNADFPYGRASSPTAAITLANRLRMIRQFMFMSVLLPTC